MYRPTVRYDDIFKDYVNDVFHATHLDRNQIIRAALFTAAHSEEFRKLLSGWSKSDVPLPSPDWQLTDSRYWMEQSPKTKGRGRDVNVDDGRKKEISEASRNDFGRRSEGSGRFEPIARSRREIPSQPIRVTGGGISFTLD